MKKFICLSLVLMLIATTGCGLAMKSDKPAQSTGTIKGEFVMVHTTKMTTSIDPMKPPKYDIGYYRGILLENGELMLLAASDDNVIIRQGVDSVMAQVKDLTFVLEKTGLGYAAGVQLYSHKLSGGMTVYVGRSGENIQIQGATTTLSTHPDLSSLTVFMVSSISRTD
ncbi:MAG: hypothetical protein R6W96_08320 [Clostridia bacterium]